MIRSIKSLAKRIIEVIQFIASKVIILFLRANEAKLIVIGLDGGVCSQIDCIVLGEKLREKGYSIRYDLSWFNEWGFDMFGTQPRPYYAWVFFNPDLIKLANRRVAWALKHYSNFEQSGNDIMTVSIDDGIMTPVYVRNYLSYMIEEDDYRSVNWERAYDLLTEGVKQLADRIKILNSSGNTVTVGVHVRRGDMAAQGYYFPVLSSEYFIRTIYDVKSRFKDADMVFFFFSNGFEFVEEEILPTIGKDIDYVLVKNNKDYEDIYLYTLCSIQVASQSGWGKSTFRFNSNPNKLLFAPTKHIESDIERYADIPYSDRIVWIDLKKNPSYEQI